VWLILCYIFPKVDLFVIYKKLMTYHRTIKTYIISYAGYLYLTWSVQKTRPIQNAKFST